MQTNNFIPLDADCQGELLALCADLHSEWEAHPHIYFKGKTQAEMIYQCYLLGNMEGRLLYGAVTEDDLLRFGKWEEEMLANKK